MFGVRTAVLDVAVVRSSGIDYDPRVKKIIRSLSKRYNTLVLGWDRRGDDRISNIMSLGGVDVKLFSIKAPEGRPHLALYLPLFWIWIFFKLLSHRPRVIHACDLDTFLPCYLYKKILRKKLVFDVFDRYAMCFIPPKNKITYSLVNMIEEACAKKCDILINVSKKMESSFRSLSGPHEIILNCPEPVSVEKRPTSPVLTIAFTGHMRRHRGLETLLTIVKDLERVKLIVAGGVGDPALLKDVQEVNNAEYIGYLTPEEALALEANSDIIIALYDLDHSSQNVLTIGNKIFEAMMCGVPIITNNASELINEINCGIIVEYNNIDQIKNAIIRLRDNIGLRYTLGNNGRKAYLDRYSWSKMEENLYQIYDGLLQNHL